MVLQYSWKEIQRVLQGHLIPPEYTDLESLERILKEKFKTIEHSPPTESGQSQNGSLRVSSWNVRYWTRIDDVISVILSELNTSDIIALQEVGRLNGNTDVLQKIRKETGFGYVYGTEFIGLNGIPGDIGISILSKHEFLDYDILHLSSGAYQMQDRGNTLLGSNMGVKAEIIIDGNPIVFYSVHLELNTPLRQRYAQMEKLLKNAATHNRGPLIIAGDLNLTFEGKRSRALKLFRQHGFYDVFGDKGEPTMNDTLVRLLGYYLLGGRAILDRIMSRGLKRPIDSKVHSHIGISDHFPITASYRFLN